MFSIILNTVLRHGGSKNHKKKEKKWRKLKRKATVIFLLAMMFGIGWIFGVLGSIGELQELSLIFQVIFVVIVSFQGFFIFILHPFRSKEAREEWKKWYYYSTCRREQYQKQLRHSKATAENIRPSSGARPSSTAYSAATQQTESTVDQSQADVATIRDESHSPPYQVVPNKAQVRVLEEPVSSSREGTRQVFIYSSDEDTGDSDMSPFGSVISHTHDLIAFSPDITQSNDDTVEDDLITQCTVDDEDGGIQVMYTFES